MKNSILKNQVIGKKTLKIKRKKKLHGTRVPFKEIEFMELEFYVTFCK